MSFSSEIKKGIACNSVGHPHSITGRAVCLSVHPGKMLLFPFVKWFEKRYVHKYKYARTIFTFDMFLLGVALTLAIVALFSWLNPPVRFEDKITFDATVAPREIVAGAPSTLVIQYTNGTEEELHNAKLELKFPNHFLLQGVESDDKEVNAEEIDLGTIPVGKTGAIHVRGVMFGDVGGEQKFSSKLTFLHGTENDIPGNKIDEYIFSPERSTLSLTLELPNRLLAFQDVEGVITYENTGEIDVPIITIIPQWPEGFVTSIKKFETPAVRAGEKGQINFTGYLGDTDESITWTFHPSFTFGNDQYQQETLMHVAPVVPAPIKLSHSIEKTSLQPGSTTTFHLEYENIADFSISELVLGIESNSPFFTKEEVVSNTTIQNVQPGDRGTVEIQVPLRSNIRQSETNVYENLTIRTRSVAHYTHGDGSGQRVTSKGTTIESPLTTPLVFESFARYTTASGDQIGRGPLPPQVDRGTSYWIFWNVNDTTNPIKNVTIEGTLPENVEFTGKQSSSLNGGVDYNVNTRTIRWTTDSLTPTFSPTSKIVGIAFEVELTPTETQNGTSPTLLKNITFTATDSVTGAQLTRTSPNVTTFLPTDTFAQGKSEVRK